MTTQTRVTQYRGIGTAEKRAQLLADGIPWPTCSCHGEAMQWHKAAGRRLGGYMRCSVKKRMHTKKFDESPRGRAWRRVDTALHGAERVRRYRARNRDLGRCQECPAPVAHGSNRCEKHRERDIAGKRLRRRYGISAPLVRELGLNTNRRASANS